MLKYIIYAKTVPVGICMPTVGIRYLFGMLKMKQVTNDIFYNGTLK